MKKLEKEVIEIRNSRKKQFMLLLFSFVFIIAFCGTSAAATNSSTSISSPASADIQVNQTQTTFTGTNGSQYVTYTITVNNNGPDNATGVQITDTLPTGVQWDSDNSKGTYNPTTGIWNIGNLNYGDNTLLTITALITGTGTIKNTAAKTNETETDWNYNNNAQTTILTVSGTYTPNVDIRILNYPWYYNTATQSYVYNYMCGNTPSFVMDVRNSNDYDDATGVVVEYVIGNGFEYSGFDTQGVGTATYDSNTRTITWNIGYMPKGSRVFMKVLTRIIETGDNTPDLTNIARLKQVDQYDVNNANNETDCSISSPASADIQVDQTQTTSTGHGSKYVTYIITVNNNGPDNATGVQITDTLPTGVQWISDNSQGTYNPTTGIWNIGNLNYGDTKILTITALITGTGTIKNTAAKTNETETDWNYNNNAQTTILTVSGTYTPNVDIRVLAYPWYYNTDTQSYVYNYMCGNTPVFVVDVRNSNDYDDATGVVVEYVIGNGFIYNSCDTQGVGTATYDSNTRTITWNIGYMPKGGRVFMKVLTGIIETGDNTPDLTNIARLKQVDQYDVNSANSQTSYSISSPTQATFTATDSISSSSSADIQVNQTGTTFTSTNGSQYITYNINVTNNGPYNATGVQITDTLPTGVQWISDNSQGTYNPTTGIWNISNLNCGDNKTLTITVLITGTGTITNTAAKTNETETDWNYTNDAKTVVINIP